MTVPSRVPAPARFDPSMYAGLGALGVVLLVLGVWYTALQGVPYAGYLRIGLAIVGGYLTVLGWARWYQLRDEPRRRGPLPKNRPVPGLPSMEIYSPNQKDARSPPEREMAPVPTLVRPHRRAPLYTLALAALVGVLILSALSPSAFVASASSASPGHPAPATGASHLASTPSDRGAAPPTRSPLLRSPASRGPTRSTGRSTVSIPRSPTMRRKSRAAWRTTRSTRRSRRPRSAPGRRSGSRSTFPRADSPASPSPTATSTSGWSSAAKPLPSTASRTPRSSSSRRGSARPVRGTSASPSGRCS